MEITKSIISLAIIRLPLLLCTQMSNKTTCEELNTVSDGLSSAEQCKAMQYAVKANIGSDERVEDKSLVIRVFKSEVSRMNHLPSSYRLAVGFISLILYLSSKKDYLSHRCENLAIFM